MLRKEMILIHTHIRIRAVCLGGKDFGLSGQISKPCHEPKTLTAVEPFEEG